MLLLIAAATGNTVNYMIGRAIGPRVFNSHIPFLERFLDRRALQKTHDFYEKHGGKTIVLARFIPVVRTFAPFVAGVGRMAYGRFQTYNVLGGLCWVTLFVWGGYLFGNIPVIKQNFGLVTIVIVLVSLLPLAVAALRRRTATP